MRKKVFVSIVILAALIIRGCTQKPAETPKTTTPTPAKTTVSATTTVAPATTVTVAATTPAATTKAVKYSASNCTILTADYVNSVTKSSIFVFETGTT